MVPGGLGIGTIGAFAADMTTSVGDVFRIATGRDPFGFNQLSDLEQKLAFASAILVVVPISQLSKLPGGFRGKLIKFLGFEIKGAHAHHVFPQKFAREFAEVGIEVGDPRFGAWWEASDHLRNWYDYNEAWGEFLESPRTREEILNFGRDLAEEYGLKVNF